MSYSMMFKKFQCIALVIFLLCIPVTAEAEEKKALPSGDILVVYSDTADKDDMDSVYHIVELLTYQSFQVTFASAAECAGNLADFKSILFYEVESYPSEIIGEIRALETEAQKILEARGEDYKGATENDLRLMFVGNHFLKDYLNQTFRSHTYTACSSQVGIMNYFFNDYQEKNGLVRAEDFLFLKGDYRYCSGQVTVDETEGYFCAGTGSITHIPTGDLTNPLVEAAFIKEVAQWKWPYNGEPHAYAQYIVLNKVYPFQDPEKLFSVIQMIADRKEPFVISVMPVYANSDYPAMQRFCEVLRYAQDNGGVIFIHTPINQMTDFDVDLVNEYMTLAISGYMNQGVYPMGLQVPSNWMFQEDTIEIMSRFRTVMVSEEEDSRINRTGKEVHTNQVYGDGHQWIAPAVKLDADGVSYTKVHSTAVYFDITQDLEDIEEKLNACRESFVPTKSLWDVEHSFWTDEDIMTYKNRIILVNGKRQDKTFLPTDYEEEYSYRRNMLQRFSKDLTSENKKLIVAVVIVSAIFLLFILMARFSNRNRFFYREEEIDKDEYWENKNKE